MRKHIIILSIFILSTTTLLAQRTGIRLARLEEAPAVGAMIIANGDTFATWTAALRYVDGFILASGDTVATRDYARQFGGLSEAEVSAIVSDTADVLRQDIAANAGLTLQDITDNGNSTTNDIRIVGDGTVPNIPSAVGLYLGKSQSNNDRRLEIVSDNLHSYIDFTNTSNDYLSRIIHSNVDSTLGFHTGGGTTSLKIKPDGVINIANLAGTGAGVVGCTANGDLYGYRFDTGITGPTWGSLLYLKPDGVTEVGQALDFSGSSNNSNDRDGRIRYYDDYFDFQDVSDLRVNGNITWHEGNDGAGSGLDAGLLDGQDASYYLDNTDTQLTEAEVDAFVSNNGYLTSEVDGSTTNELQTIDEVLTQGNSLVANRSINVNGNQMQIGGTYAAMLARTFDVTLSSFDLSLNTADIITDTGEILLRHRLSGDVGADQDYMTLNASNLTLEHRNGTIIKGDFKTGNFVWNTDQDTTGTVGQVMTMSSSGELELKNSFNQVSTSNSAANFSDDLDGYSELHVAVHSNSSTLAITLPSANSTNAGKTIKIFNFFSGSGAALYQLSAGNFWGSGVVSASYTASTDGRIDELTCILDPENSGYVWAVEHN